MENMLLNFLNNEVHEEKILKKYEKKNIKLVLKEGIILYIPVTLTAENGRVSIVDSREKNVRHIIEADHFISKIL